MCVCDRGRERELETVNIDNNGYQFSENPHLVDDVPFYFFNIRAQCTMGELEIIGSIIFEEKIYSYG
jgi:hypothetical protein